MFSLAFSMGHPESERGSCFWSLALTWQMTVCKAHQFLYSKLSLGSLKEIFKCLQGNIVMFITENVFMGLEFISMLFFFSQGNLFILPFYFGGLEGEGSVYKMISLDNPSLLEHT